MATDKRFDITLKNGEIINLSKETCQKYLTNNIAISDSEFNMFFQLCKTYKVNPFLKEAYIVKYGNDPASIILDYKVLQQVAEENPNYGGMQHGVLVVDKNGEEKERVGDYVLPQETLIAGWCEITRNDKSVKTKVYSMFSEFSQTKKDGTLNKNWATKPVFMIVKVAKAQALREAFPKLFGSNIYTKEEETTFDTPQKNETITEIKDIENVIEAETSEIVLNDMDILGDE